MDRSRVDDLFVGNRKERVNRQHLADATEHAVLDVFATASEVKRRRVGRRRVEDAGLLAGDDRVGADFRRHDVDDVARSQAVR